MNTQMTIDHMTVYIEASRYGFAQGLAHPIACLMNYLDSSEMPLDPVEYKEKAKQVVDAFIAFFRGTALAGPNPESGGTTYEEYTGVPWEEAATGTGLEDIPVSVHDINDPDDFFIDPIAYLDYDGLYLMIFQHYNQDQNLDELDPEQLKAGFEAFKLRYGLEDQYNDKQLSFLFGVNHQNNRPG